VRGDRALCPVNAYDMRVMLSGISEAGAKDILNALAEEFGVKWIIDEIGVDYILNEIGEEEIKSHFDKS
jgi:hypothetical protein